MKRLLFISWILAAIALEGQVIDRIVAVVNNRIITSSDVRREQLIREVLRTNQSRDADVVVKELIDNQIIEEQVAQFPGIDVSDERVQAEIDKISDLKGLPRETLRDAVRQRIRNTEFFDQRFRLFTRVSDEEVRQYYDRVFVPEAQKRGVNPVPSFEQVADGLRNNVIEEKLVRDIDAWLEALRRRSNIEVFE